MATQNIIFTTVVCKIIELDFETFLQNKFCSSCLCVILFLHSFWLSFMHVTVHVKSTMQFSEKKLYLIIKLHVVFTVSAAVNFEVLASFLGNNIFIKDSNKLSKPQHVNQWHLETIWQVSFKQPWQDWNYTTNIGDTFMYIFTSDTLMQPFFSCIFKTNQLPIVKCRI